jgi:hypothetical protein
LGKPCLQTTPAAPHVCKRRSPLYGPGPTLAKTVANPSGLERSRRAKLLSPANGVDPHCATIMAKLHLELRKFRRGRKLRKPMRDRPPPKSKNTRMRSDYERPVHEQCAKVYQAHLGHRMGSSRAGPVFRAVPEVPPILLVGEARILPCRHFGTRGCRSWKVLGGGSQDKL